MAKMPKIGLTRKGSSTIAEPAGELTVDGHEVTVVIYGKDGEIATYSGFHLPTIALPPESRATGGALGSAS